MAWLLAAFIAIVTYTAQLTYSRAGYVFFFNALLSTGSMYSAISQYITKKTFHMPQQVGTREKKNI